MHKLVFAALLIVATSFSISGQTLPHKSDTIRFTRHELGLDPTYFITFLKRNSQSYLLNYKYSFNRQIAARLGGNLAYSTLPDGEFDLDIRLGAERKFSWNRWQLFTGADASFKYLKTNYQSNLTRRWGVSPLIGARYWFSRHFSISTETKFNIFLYQLRNSDSFDPNANKDFWELGIGSVGLVWLSFHF